MADIRILFLAHLIIIPIVYFPSYTSFALRYFTDQGLPLVLG